MPDAELKLTDRPTGQVVAYSGSLKGDIWQLLIKPYLRRSPNIRERIFLLGGLYQWVATVDHKRLGPDVHRVGAGVFGGRWSLMAAVMRLQLAVPNRHIVDRRDIFNRLFTMHGTTMVFLSGCQWWQGSPIIWCR